jgi:LPXTG-motif cell wall-anchored protein
VANNQVERIGSSSPTQVAGNSTSRSSGSGATGLATTGSTVRPMILLGAILIAAGALFALGARRRRD